MDEPLLQEASDPKTSPERLRELCVQSQALAIAVAQNPASPPSLLKQLSSSNNAKVREAIVQNPNTPYKTLFHLGTTLPSLLLKNPALPLLLLENPNLFGELPLKTLKKLLTEPDAPPSLLEWASRHINVDVRHKVAAHSASPPEVLCRLAGDSKPPVRKAVSENRSAAEVLALFRRAGATRDLAGRTTPDPGLPEEVLEQLATGEDFACFLVTHHPNASEAALTTVARKLGSLEEAIRLALAQHPKTPSGVLGQLLYDSSPVIRAEAMKHPNVPRRLLSLLQQLTGSEELGDATPPRLSISAEEITELMEGASFWVKKLIARHPNTPLEILQLLSAEPIYELQAALAKNPRAPESLLGRLGPLYYTPLAEALCANPNTPQALLQNLIQQNVSSLSRLLATNPSAPESFLRGALLRSDDSILRSNAARNPSAPKALLSLLQKLATNDLTTLRAASACTESELEELWALGGFAKVGAARFMNLTEEKISQIRASEEQVRGAAAQNPSAPQSLLEELSRDPSMWVKESLAESRFAGAALLERLSQNPEAVVRWAVARNPYAPRPVLALLAQDKDSRVRASALRNL